MVFGFYVFGDGFLVLDIFLVFLRSLLFEGLVKGSYFSNLVEFMEILVWFRW